MAEQPGSQTDGRNTREKPSLARRIIPKTLGTRLALTYSGLALLIMAILGGSLVGTIRAFYVDRLQVELLEEAAFAGEVLAPLIEDGADSRQLDEMTSRLANALNVRLTLIASDGNVLVDSAGEEERMDNHAGRPEVVEALRQGSGSSMRISSTVNVPFFYVARTIADQSVIVRVAVPLSEVDGLVRDIQRLVALAALTAGVLMTGAGWFVARRISSALEAIRTQASAVAAGDLTVMVSPAPTRELGDLGRAFNSMTQTLRGTLSELDLARKRLEATLADLSDGVIITDDQGHVVLANGAARGMLGASGNVIGMPLVEVGRDHELAELVSQSLSSAGTLFERVIHHSLTGKTLQAAARRLDTREERIGVIVLRDITELRRLEGVRRDFVANVSHELRTPLTSIRALVETLEAGAVNDPEVSADFLSRIVAEVDRLAHLVDELLDLARLESGRITLRVELIDPKDAVERAIGRLAPQTERAGLTVTADVEPGAASFLGDRERIDQVLLNLIHNAIKFTPGGGSILVTASPREQSTEFQVRDTGIGVLPDEIPRLFERFYKTDRARRSVGTGLGLAISKHIVQAHGGRIWAEQNLPSGMAFIVQLPIEGPEESGSVRVEHRSLASAR